MIALLALLAATSVQAGPELKVWFLDVGQGDAAVIRSPTGKWVLIDSGPPQAGPRIAKFLQEKKAGPIDLAILTHPHLDHVGGMAQAVEAVGLKLLMDPGYPHPLPQYEALLRLLQKKTIAIKDAVAGRRVELGEGAALEILWPRKPFLTSTRSDVNSASVVLRLVYGKQRVLFTGDVEAVVEDKLLAEGAAVQAQVLKVAHHGSRHSSTLGFLRAVHPEMAVVSCGESNDYKHPHAETLARLGLVGAKILRIDEVGDVTLTTDGESEQIAGARAPPEVAAAPPRLAHAGGEQPFAASKRSHVFHRSSCAAVAKIRPANLVYFKSREEAAKDKKPAQDCDP